jgi:sialate O-acetylesterase
MLSRHGVLQRDRPIHIWGWADPAECVRISFHGQEQQICSDSLGAWSTYLKPEAAGGPYALAVTGKGNAAVTVEDLLGGDVWFASGQSNMEMPLKGFGPDTPIKDSAKEIAAAKHPAIRLLRFAKSASPYPLDDVSATWTECVPETAATFSAAAYFFGREIQTEENVPVGLIDSSWGGTPIESWISLGAIGRDAALMPLFESRAKFIEGLAAVKARIAAEKQEDEEARQAGKPAPIHKWHPDESSWNASYLFNGMVAPARAYTVRGFLWYQGETNSDPERAPLYRREMTTLVEDWRRQWGEGQLPFLYVQISSFTSPGENWGEIRNAQREALSVANTAMAVRLDVGTPGNVHPPDKQTIGHRLALAARALSYGETTECSGPLVREADEEGNAVRVWFEHARGLAPSGAVKGFEVAGTNGRYQAATARVEGESIVVRADDVPAPRSVRYAWSNATDADLVNGAGLPASTFEVGVKR